MLSWDSQGIKLGTNHIGGNGVFQSDFCNSCYIDVTYMGINGGWFKANWISGIFVGCAQSRIQLESKPKDVQWIPAALCGACDPCTELGRHKPQTIDNTRAKLLEPLKALMLESLPTALVLIELMLEYMCGKITCLPGVIHAIE